MVASTGFIAVALSANAASTPYGRAVLIALVLSWFGDLFLTFSTRRAFLGGLIAFLAGHVAYIFAFAIRGTDTAIATVAAVAAGLIAIGIWRWLRPHVEPLLQIPVAVYIIVISAMIAMAFGTAGRDFDARIVVGATSFFVSDIAVARNRFVARGFVNRAWGLPLYYAGQLLLAASTGR